MTSEASTETSTKKSKLKYLLGFLASSLAFTGAVLGAGSYAHSSPAHETQILKLQTQIPDNPITDKIFWLMGMDKYYYIFTYTALQNGIKPEIAEKSLPVDYIKQGEERMLDLAKTKSAYKEVTESTLFQARMKLNPPHRLSEYEREFLNILAQLEEEKQRLATEYAKDGIISWTDVYSIKKIKELPLETLKELKRTGHLYPVIDKDKDGIPDPYDPNPDIYNPVYLILGFPHCDPPKSWYVFDDPWHQKTDKEIMNSTIKGFEELGIPKNHIFYFPGNLSKEGFHEAIDKIVLDIHQYYPGRTPYIFLFLDSHGGPHSIWAPWENYTTEKDIELKKKLGANYSPRPLLIFDYEIANAIQKIEEASGKDPVIFLEIDACDSDDFIKNILSKIPRSKNKPYFGITLLITPYGYAGDDYDKNRIIDYNDLSWGEYGKPLENVTYNTPPVKLVIGNVRAMKEHFYIPISSELYKTSYESLENDYKIHRDPECLKWIPNYARLHNYPIDYIKAYFGF